MRKQLILIAVALFGTALSMGAASAQEGEGSLPHAGADINNTESLQRGARNFMNYCSGCHSLKYLRYNRMAADLKIPESELAGNLMFTGDKVFDTINSAMPKDSEGWFGKQPPDLSLMARARGVDYLYSYMKGFYVDKTRPWGVNNLYLPSAAMPDVLAQLHGLQKPVFKNEPDDRRTARIGLLGGHATTPGALQPGEDDSFGPDIRKFLYHFG